MPKGPLGLPRLTTVGPLVENQSFGFSQELENEDQVAEEMLEIINENNIDRDDPTLEELADVADEMAQEIYPRDDPVNRAKHVRFKNCLANEWSNNWVDGLAEATNALQEGDEMDRLFFQIRGCIGVTESNVADDERIIPQQFKE